MKFEPVAEGTHYTVSTTGPEGLLSCQTPCTLHLLPGPLQLHITGDGSFDPEIKVPQVNAVTRISHVSVSNRVLPLVASISMLALAGVITAVLVYPNIANGDFGALTFVGIGLVTLCVGVGVVGVIAASIARSKAEVSEVPDLVGSRRKKPAGRLISFGAGPVHNGAVAGARLVF